MTITHTFGAFALIASLAAPAAAQSPADAAIDKAVAAYKGMRSARATFEQTITNPLTGSTVSSRGEFEQQQPGRFIFRFTDPKGDRIVADGKSVWLYLPSSNPGQVIRTPLSRAGVGSLDLTGQFFTSPRTRYTIVDGGAATIAGNATRALKLEPKGDAEPFERATVWVDTDDGTLRQFETIDRSGVKRLVRVTSLVPNAKVDPDTFHFSPPKGVRVVDQ
jgi:outer membrane lipoprotein carrier protein